jgi:hypothetical protein
MKLKNSLRCRFRDCIVVLIFTLSSWCLAQCVLTSIGSKRLLIKKKTQFVVFAVLCV